MTFLIVGIFQLCVIPSMHTCLLQSDCNLLNFNNEYRDNHLNVKLLGIINLFVITSLKLVFAYSMKHKERKADQEFVTVNDYTLFVKWVPNTETEESTAQMINEIYKHRETSIHSHDEEEDDEVVVKVNFVYNIKDLQSDIEALVAKQKTLSKWEVKYPKEKYPGKHAGID